MSQISCLRVDRYEPELLFAAVQTQFEQLKLAERVRPGMKVLIKPNLLMKRRPEEFTTTHPAVVGAVVQMLQTLGVKDIVIADSPGGPYTKPLLTAIYRTSGFSSLAEQYGITLNEAVGHGEVKNPANVLCKAFELIDPVREADLIIDICKFKTHGMVGLSGAVKNLFGCVPGLMKPELHFRFPEEEHFCEMLVDLCETVRPSIVFVDAIDAMQGDGPSGGSKLHTGMLLAGTNPYEIDLLLCQIAALDPKRIYTVDIAMKRGLCAGMAEELELVGDAPLLYPDFKKPTTKDVNFSNSMPRWIPKSLVYRFASRPKINRKGCIGCGKCAESCPAKTIELKEHKAYIHYENCIKCYCCHEMCPVNTIHIKRSRFFHF